MNPPCVSRQIQTRTLRVSVRFERNTNNEAYNLVTSPPTRCAYYSWHGPRGAIRLGAVVTLVGERLLQLLLAWRASQLSLCPRRPASGCGVALGGVDIGGEWRPCRTSSVPPSCVVGLDIRAKMGCRLTTDSNSCDNRHRRATTTTCDDDLTPRRLTGIVSITRVRKLLQQGLLRRGWAEIYA